MKLLIQNKANKFISNLKHLSSPSLQIACIDISNNLYGLLYKYNFDAYLFVSSLLTKEIYQFIDEFIDTKKIIIYHEGTEGLPLIQRFGNRLIHLSEKSIESDTIVLPRLINENLFFNKGKDRISATACFLEDLDRVPHQLEKILYPKAKNKIHLFAKKIDHPQNLGYLSEIEKSDVLNKYQSYITLDNYYDIEAAICGSQVLSLNEDGIIEDIDIDTSKIKTYTNFLYEILL